MILDPEEQADTLIAKLKHYLITTMGRILDEANADEIYQALSYALREEIMINWLAIGRTQVKKDTRFLYYLSMEYLPGRILSNTITNLTFNDLVQVVLRKINRSYAEIISREEDPSLGNGGLGRLASCLLDSLATLNYPARAYGLRYQYGIFEQQIWDGLQIEAPDCWLTKDNPWDFRRDQLRTIVKYGGRITPSINTHGEEIHLLEKFEEVAALPFDIPIIGFARGSNFSLATLRLWSTNESPSNFQLQRYNAGVLDQAFENTTLTDVLYPSDHHETGRRIRLKQEFLLVSASVQDIIAHYQSGHENFEAFADKVRIQINDTHPALVIPELIRNLTANHNIPWEKAVDITRVCTGYTNHTILKEAMEEWDQNLFYQLLPRQYQIIQRINYDFCNSIRAKYPHDEEKVRRMSIIENGKVRMAHLSIVGAHSVNGVAALHSEILKETVFKDFYELYPEKFFNVTNGVTQRRWLLHSNPSLANFITKRIGDGWITDFNQIRQLAKFAEDAESQREFLEIKKQNKMRLIELIDQINKPRDSNGDCVACPLNFGLDPNSIFDIQVKRIHEYKRQLMNALHVVMLYYEILENPHHKRLKRTVIFGGKAAAGYETAKEIIRFINAIARKIDQDPAVQGFLKVVFIANYNVSKAEIIIPAADLSEQISTAGTEASGTGNMKFSMNGALTIGTEDGANIEMRQEIGDQWWPFSFGCLADQIETMKAQNSYNARSIYDNNPKIQRAVNSLRDRTFAANEIEHLAFGDLFHQLIETQYGGPADRYFILKDLEDYYKCQQKVEDIYHDPSLWAQYAIHNIAGMGKFSTDRSIKDYSDLIWQIEPCPVDKEILAKIRREYQLMDVCRIY